MGSDHLSLIGFSYKGSYRGNIGMPSHGDYHEEKDIENCASSTNKEDDDVTSEFERVYNVFHVSMIRRFNTDNGNAIEYERIVVRP